MATLTELLTTATGGTAKTGKGQGLEIGNIMGKLSTRLFSPSGVTVHNELGIKRVLGDHNGETKVQSTMR